MWRLSNRVVIGVLLVFGHMCLAAESPIINIDIKDSAAKSTVQVGFIQEGPEGLAQTEQILERISIQRPDVEIAIHTDAPKKVVPGLLSAIEGSNASTPQLILEHKEFQTDRPKRPLGEAWRGQSHYPGFWFYAVSGTQALFYVFYKSIPTDMTVLAMMIALPLNYFYIVKSDFAFEVLVRAKDALQGSAFWAFSKFVKLKEMAKAAGIRLFLSDYIALDVDTAFIQAEKSPSALRRFFQSARARLKSESPKLFLNFGINSLIAAPFEAVLAGRQVLEVFSHSKVYMDIFLLGGTLGAFVSGTWDAVFLRWEQKLGTREQVFERKWINRFYEVKNAFMGMLFPFIYANFEAAIAFGVVSGVSGLIVSLDINDRIFFERGARFLQKGSDLISRRFLTPTQEYVSKLPERSPVLRGAARCFGLIRLISGR